MGQNHNANGDWALAERELRRAAWFATEDLFIGEIDYQLATTYLATSRLDRARQFLERVSANSPRYYEASISLGDMAEQSGQLSSAFHRYADAVLAQTDSTVAHKRFMATGGQLLVAGHATEVEDVCRNMLAARAESREIRLLLAVSLHLQERYSESVFESERLIEKYPDFEIARLHLAQSLEAGGRRAEAVTAYRYLLDLDNISDPVKEAARRRLSELAATPVAGRGSQTGISR
jgi:tetratricopeptide (TPR) repeat protein